MKQNKNICALTGFVLILLILAGCEMAPVERSGVVELNVNGPGTMAGIGEGSRLISMDARSLVVLAYPSFDDGILEVDTPLDFYTYRMGTLNSIINSSATKKIITDLADSRYTSLSGLEPGPWSFILFSYNSEISDWDSVAPLSCESYCVKKNVEIQGGYNSLSILLGLNSNYGSRIGVADGISETGKTLSAGKSYFCEFTNMAEGTYHLDYIFESSNASINDIPVVFHSNAGGLLSSQYYETSSTTDYWEGYWNITIPPGTTSLIIEVYNPTSHEFLNALTASRLSVDGSLEIVE